jgi:putative transposase
VTLAADSDLTVEGPFLACIRVDGKEVRACLSDLSLGQLRKCRPVRSPRIYQHQQHMSGRWFSTTVGGFLEYERLLERDWMLLLDFDREVEWMCEQPMRLRYSKDGRQTSHVPDLLVWRDGVPELCDIKSAERLEDTEFLAQVRTMELACAEAGVGYRVLAEPDPQLLVNVRWLAGYREPPVDLDGERERMLSALSVGQSTIGELLSGAREPMLARPVLMHLLWTGEAMVDLSVAFCEDSHVWARSPGGGVMGSTWPLDVDGPRLIDGEAITVSAVDGAKVCGVTAGSERTRFVPTRAAQEPAHACNEEWRFGSVLLDAGALSDAQSCQAGELLGHLNEASFGYRSGDPGRPSPGEPRALFDPAHTTLGERLQAKAAELGCSASKLRQKRRNLERKGLAALVDGRATRSANGPEINPRLRAAILAEAEGLANASDVRKMQFRARVASRLARESGEPLVLPSSRQTFNRIVDKVLASTGLFRLPAKSRRSAQSAPSENLGSLVAERPGEYVAIDTTSLDVFAIDPFTFQWVRLDLTVALDLHTRSILTFRLTPFSTQGVDLALLLSDLLSPTPKDGRWPANVPYPYCGVPENLVLRAFELPADAALSPRPTVRPGTIVIDNGRNYQSVAFMAACEHLRINVQSARPYRGSDKGWIERLFRTLRERLLESLPGYTGQNVLARGKDVEADAVYFTHELEAIIGRWIALDYQRRPHDGLRVPEAPHLTLSPNEAYEEALARAGFLYVLPDRDLHLRLLPVQARVIGRAGVEITGLTYDSPALNPYRQRRSPLNELDGKWPIRLDPRDLGRVWFQDPRDERFHELSWRYAREVSRPFGASTLNYVKRLLVDASMQRPSEEEIATELAHLLHELSDEDLFRDRRARREAVRQAVIAEQRRAPARPAEVAVAPARPEPNGWSELQIPALELQQ